MGYRIRKKKNSSGSTSVQIIDRENRGYRVVETVGCSKDEAEIEMLHQRAIERIDALENNLLYVTKDHNDKKQLEDIFSSITNDNIIPIGDELIYGRLFRELRCDTIFTQERLSIRKRGEKQFLFKALVISRILYPGSKLYLSDYLEHFKKQAITTDKIYRFLDTLYQEEIKEQIETCIFNHTQKIMNNTITVTFYDVTTLYFEGESEDDLRRIGFSKEGKLARPQILLGLFTTLEGYPLSYEVYEGNKYEGHTLTDILEKFQHRFSLTTKPIVVADKGMLSSMNIAYLENNGYTYILAYKIKSVDEALKAKIANIVFNGDGDIHTIEIEKVITYKDNEEKRQKMIIKQKLILTYSSTRAKKDKRAREKAIEKIEATLNKKNITKSDLKLSYYAKYLDVDEQCTIQYKLNSTKIELDAKLDGIKGFATNDFSLKANDVIAHYQNQYAVERAFRISKTDLRIRPIYHRLEHRIKAHILVSFVAYALFREFERKLKLKDIEFDVSQKLLRKIIEHFLAVKINGKVIPLKPSKIQQKILEIFLD